MHVQGTVRPVPGFCRGNVTTGDTESRGVHSRSDSSPTESLSRRTARAAQWRAGLSISQATFQFGVGIILARLLPPEDFGLVALALIVTGFARFASNLGLAPALIQRKEIQERHVRVAFTLSVMLGAAVTALVYIFAPLSAPLFDNPGVPPILRAASLTFVATGFGNTAGALLKRRLDFRTIFMVGNTSYLFSFALVGIPMAYLDYGVWSLVVAIITQRAIETVLLLGTTRHPMVPLWSSQEIRELGLYGVGFTLGGLADYLGRVGDNFVTGRWLGNHALGLYTRAYGLMMMPRTYLSDVVEQVLFPAFSEVQDHRERLGSAYLYAVQLVTLLAVPLMAGMVVAAPHMIIGLYGAEWSGAVAPLQILCAAGWFAAVYPLSGVVARATGNVYAYSIRAMLFATLVLAGGIVGTRWGVAGVATAVAAATFVHYLVMARLSLRLLPHHGWGGFVRVQYVGIFVGFLVGGAALIARFLLIGLGLGHLTVFFGILSMCSLTLALAIYFLPSFVRPRALFDRIAQVSEGWPSMGRNGIRWFFRTESDT